MLGGQQGQFWVRQHMGMTAEASWSWGKGEHAQSGLQIDFAEHTSSR